MQKHRGFRQQVNKVGKKHLKKAQDAYFKKLEEYSKLSLEELKAKYAPNDKILLGGIHRTALLAVVEDKQRLERERKLAEATNELGTKLDKVIEETTSKVPETKIIGEGDE